MITRNLSSKLINALINQSGFWKQICSDLDFRPEIRNDKLTVYYGGQAFLGEIKLEKGSLVAKTNIKFVPTIKEDAAELTLVEQPNGSGLRFKNGIRPLEIGIASESICQGYKNRIEKEWGPESKLVRNICRHGGHKSNQILDQEVVFQTTDDPRNKIDICHFDFSVNAIVFAEIKRVNDGRLFLSSRNDEPEVISQLRYYGQQINKYKKELVSVYKNVLRLKSAIGLENRFSSAMTEVNIEKIVTKPVLVIGNCSKVQTKKILDGQNEWEPLRNSIEKVAAGLIVIGKDGGRLSLLHGRQRQAFGYEVYHPKD